MTFYSSFKGLVQSEAIFIDLSSHRFSPLIKSLPRHGVNWSPCDIWQIRYTVNNHFRQAAEFRTNKLPFAAAIVTALNTVVSRNVDPMEPAVLNIGRFASGERRNIIAGEGILEGTIRAFNEETYSILRSRLINTAKHMAESFECTSELDIRDMYPAVVNDSELFEVFKSIFDEADLEVIKPMTIAEDFSYYQRKIPGLFFMLGSRNDELGYIHPLHSNRFNFNEDILLTGIQIFENIRRKFE